MEKDDVESRRLLFERMEKHQRPKSRGNLTCLWTEPWDGKDKLNSKAIATAAAMKQGHGPNSRVPVWLLAKSRAKPSPKNGSKAKSRTKAGSDNGTPSHWTLRRDNEVEVPGEFTKDRASAEETVNVELPYGVSNGTGQFQRLRAQLEERAAVAHGRWRTRRSAVGVRTEQIADPPPHISRVVDALNEKHMLAGFHGLDADWRLGRGGHLWTRRAATPPAKFRTVVTRELKDTRLMPRPQSAKSAKVLSAEQPEYATLVNLQTSVLSQMAKKGVSLYYAVPNSPEPNSKLETCQ